MNGDCVTFAGGYYHSNYFLFYDAGTILII